jgi:hypothetical protein
VPPATHPAGPPSARPIASGNAAFQAEKPLSARDDFFSGLTHVAHPFACLRSNRPLSADGRGPPHLSPWMSFRGNPPWAPACQFGPMPGGWDQPGGPATLRCRQGRVAQQWMRAAAKREAPPCLLLASIRLSSIGPRAIEIKWPDRRPRVLRDQVPDARLESRESVDRLRLLPFATVTSRLQDGHRT